MRQSSVLLTLVVLACALRPAYSCTCIPDSGSTRHKVLAAYQDAAFVGIVRITGTRLLTEMHNPNGRYMGLRDSATPSQYPHMLGDTQYLVASFEVIHVWKGRDIANKEIATFVGMGACGIPFQTGQVVMLYADTPNYTGLMRADGCGRSNLADEAVEDISILSRKYGNPPPPNNRWRGP
jgi:hypothetical protein